LTPSVCANAAPSSPSAIEEQNVDMPGSDSFLSAPTKERHLLNDRRWQAACVCLGLGVITFAVFGQTLGHEFVNFDDNDYLFDNPAVAQGLTFKGIVWAFSCHASNWHPLTWFSHMLDCQLYGLCPAGHHLTNVLLHTATVILLFLVLRQMTGALWRSAFVAAVFAIHPLRVESVAWVAERKDVLSGLFFMLTIGAYVRYVRRPWSPARYGLVLLLFALGLMSKPMLVTLPLVLLLLDYWPLQRLESAGRLAMEKLPLLALSAAVGVATLLAQKGSMQSTESFLLPLRLANALMTGMVYLGQMVWPAGLAAFYPFPHKGLPPWEVALAGTLLAGLSTVAWRQRRKEPWIWVGWLWYLAMLLPVVGIIQVGDQAHADRYTYLPQIGIYLAVTWLAAKWPASRMAFGGLMTAVLAVLMICAWKQTAYWRDSETLWTRALACAADNVVARGNLGAALLQKGRADEAITQLQHALQINPNSMRVHFSLATAFVQRGKVDQAIAEFRNALQINPNYAQAHYNLGNVLLQKGRVDEAAAHYQQALQIAPGYAQAHNNLGDVFLRKGRVEEAILHYQRALQSDPECAPAYVNLGGILLQRGKADEAIVHFQKALQIKPGFAEAHKSLGNALRQKGRVEEAISQFQQALQLEPDQPEVQNNLAWLLATGPQASLRNGERAVQLAQRANELAGGKNPILLRTLAAALAEAGRFDDATRSAHKAIEMAAAAGRQDLAGQLNVELKRYEARLPLHE
jgi:tetratricopeptide (TPR) repeat protein